MPRTTDRAKAEPNRPSTGRRARITRVLRHHADAVGTAHTARLADARSRVAELRENGRLAELLKGLAPDPEFEATVVPPAPRPQPAESGWTGSRRLRARYLQGR